MNTQRFGILALALSAIATVLPAQQGAIQRRPQPAGPPAPQGAPGIPRRGPGGPGMQGGPAAMILGQGAQLNLTDDQVKKLQALQGAQKDAEPSQTAMMRLQADLMDANKGEGNIEAARVALDKMSRVRNDAVIARMKSRKDARDVLTAAQRAQLDQMGSRMRQGAGMRMRGGMPNRGRAMQRGGMGAGMRGDIRGGMIRRNGPGMQGGGMRGNRMGPMPVRPNRGPGLDRDQMDMVGPPRGMRRPPSDSARPDSL